MALPFLALSALAARAGDGLHVRGGDASPWPHWQARIGLGTRPGSTGGTTGAELTRIVLLGDYYLTGPGFGAGAVQGGLRATSGLLLGGRSTAVGTPAFGSRTGVSFTLSSSGVGGGWAAGEPNTGVAAGSTPYVGVGYTGNAQRGAFSFSADLGLMAVGTGSGLRVAGPGTTAPNLDDLLRDMRLTPVLQLGVSYAF